MTDAIKVLVVDDNPALRDLTAELLERVSEPISVGTEANPSKVLARLSRDTFHCVVSDYHMPNMDGLELCRTVRREYPNLPYFLLSTDDEPGTIERTLEVGATDYIHKETGIEHYRLLANRIERAVEHERVRHELEELTSGP